MKHAQIKAGFENFVDAASMEFVEEPVFFPHHPHVPTTIYGKATADRLFADIDQCFLEIQLLQEASSQFPGLKQNLTDNVWLHKLVEDQANQILGRNTVADILAGNHLVLDQILDNGAVARDFRPRDMNGKIDLTLIVVHGQALEAARKKVIYKDGGQAIPLRRGQAVCMLTRGIIEATDMQSALLFRNMFLIAVRNACAITSPELAGTAEGRELLDVVAILPPHEIKAAEDMLAKVDSGQVTPLLPWQLELLSTWGCIDIAAMNDVVLNGLVANSNDPDLLQDVLSKRGGSIPVRAWLNKSNAIVGVLADTPIADGEMKGTTPLWDAIYSEQWGLVKELLDKGAKNLNAAPEGGRFQGTSAFFLLVSKASAQGQWGLVEWVLNNRAVDCDAMVINNTAGDSKIGTTPLWHAANSKEWGIVDLMLAKGALNLHAAPRGGENAGQTVDEILRERARPRPSF